MAQILVRNIDDEVVEAHRRRAGQKGRSLEQELRVVLTEAALPRAVERLQALDELRARIAAAHGGPIDVDVVQLIHEGRDERTAAILGDRRS